MDLLFNHVAIKKTIFICGDFNIDLLKHDSRSGTKYFLDLMFSLGTYTVITKPTRISNVSATLTDNIFTNDINSDITSGLLITDIKIIFPFLLFVSMTVMGVVAVSLQHINVKHVRKM